MSGRIDSQNENSLASSIHPVASNTPSKNNVEQSPSGNLANNTYNDSFESASNKKSRDSTNDRQFSDFNLSSTLVETQSPPVKSLSPWEQWLCSKEEEKRNYRLKLNEDRRRKEINSLIKEEKEFQKKALTEAAHERWLKRVKEDYKKQIKIQNKKIQQERKLREEKEQLIKEIAPQKFNEWKNEKDKLKAERKSDEKIKMQKELEKLEVKKNQSQEAFDKWLKELSIKPKYQRSLGYGYAGGVLISYYDGTSSSRPSYINPKPWISCVENIDD